MCISRLAPCVVNVLQTVILNMLCCRLKSTPPASTDFTCINPQKVAEQQKSSVGHTYSITPAYSYMEMFANSM